VTRERKFDADSANGQSEGESPRRSASRVSRRGVILGAAAAGTGMAAGLVVGADPASAANGGSVLLGRSNSASVTTTITNNKKTTFEASCTAAGGSNDTAIGVYGTSTTGYGVRGDSSALFAGVGGYASGEGSSGVYGESTGANGFGLYGFASGTGGQALFADGNATVTGTLSKGGGSFRIDHPLDPGEKYLYHSFVESPDMMNVYNGTVVLGSDGGATVELPDWFEALNRDYRYQLTAIGKPAPNLHISKEVTEGSFSIAGGKAGQKVSWQLTGIRQDAWANANRIPVEAMKQPEDRGRYLHPDLFGGEAIGEIVRGLRNLQFTSEGAGV